VWLRLVPEVDDDEKVGAHLLGGVEYVQDAVAVHDDWVAAEAVLEHPFVRAPGAQGRDVRRGEPVAGLRVRALALDDAADAAGAAVKAAGLRPCPPARDSQTRATLTAPNFLLPNRYTLDQVPCNMVEGGMRTYHSRGAKEHVRVAGAGNSD